MMGLRSRRTVNGNTIVVHIAALMDLWSRRMVNGSALFMLIAAMTNLKSRRMVNGVFGREASSHVPNG
jgi:hypothetical protein